MSLKAFKHYFSRHGAAKDAEQESSPTDAAAEATDPADGALLDRLMRDFGGRDNIVQVDACLTRLRVTVKSLAAVDAAGLQQAGAIGVVIIGHEVHAIFGTRSDSLRQLLEARFFSPG